MAAGKVEIETIFYCACTEDAGAWQFHSGLMTKNYFFSPFTVLIPPFTEITVLITAMLLPCAVVEYSFV